MAVENPRGSENMTEALWARLGAVEEDGRYSPDQAGRYLPMMEALVELAGEKSALGEWVRQGWHGLLGKKKNMGLEACLAQCGDGRDCIVVNNGIRPEAGGINRPAVLVIDYDYSEDLITAIWTKYGGPKAVLGEVTVSITGREGEGYYEVVGPNRTIVNLVSQLFEPGVARMKGEGHSVMERAPGKYGLLFYLDEIGNRVAEDESAVIDNRMPMELDWLPEPDCDDRGYELGRNGRGEMMAVIPGDGRGNGRGGNGHNRDVVGRRGRDGGRNGGGRSGGRSNRNGRGKR